MYTSTRQRRSSHDSSRDGGAERFFPLAQRSGSDGAHGESVASPPSGFAHDFSGIAASRMPGGRLQRACACGGTCSKCAGDRLEKERGRVRAMRDRQGEAEQSTVPSSVDDVLRSPGESLDRSTRAFMESRFGHDFSRVRVHTDGAASRSASDLDARAWTFGDDIAFGSGLYAPQSPQGAGLLAHELTHVVQQQGGVRSSGAMEIGPAGDVYEQQAEAGAAAITEGIQGGLSPRIQRSFVGGLLDVLLFIPRLFGLEYFPAEDLRDYLNGLRTRRGPEGSLFGDNKARACVSREAELGPYDTQTKIWLVEEMLQGWTSGLDEGAIITLVRRSADKPQIVSAIGRDRLWSKFSGENRRIIEALTMTAADAGDALVSRLRRLDPGELQAYRSNTTDPAVQESIRRAAALANITAPVPDNATISPAGDADFVINGVRVTVGQDRINPATGMHAFTHSQFDVSGPAEMEITPGAPQGPVGPIPPVDMHVTIWTEFASEEQKRGTSGYGVGTRPGDVNTLQTHERGHGEAWFSFLRDNPPPAFTGRDGMLPAEYNAAVRTWTTAMEAYRRRAADFAQRSADCVGTLPTDAQLAGTGFTASICHTAP